MMVLLFKLDNAKYALDVAHIVEIMPRIAIKPLPRVPDYIPGLINYRGRIVPVVDLAMLVHKHPASHSLSTRIILVQFDSEEGHSQLVGMIAECATETTKIDVHDALTTGISSNMDAFVDAIILDRDEMIGIVNLARLMPHELQIVVSGSHEAMNHEAGIGNAP
ncbi:MAG: purine-binding chemotaxis protein CheW [Gammaproteobacteria bacterium]|nr:purine-binding chemotaxis protein CheW [Gammaproteobacteria bacterium]